MNYLDFTNDPFDTTSMVVLCNVDWRLASIILMGARSWRKTQTMQLRVTSGLRSEEEQRRLFISGKSWTMNSRHLDGCAVDLAILSLSRHKAYWGLEQYRELNHHMQAAAAVLGYEDDLEWGGNWKQRDGVHWQLNLPRLK